MHDISLVAHLERAADEIIESLGLENTSKISWTIALCEDSQPATLSVSMQWTEKSAKPYTETFFERD